MIISLFLLLVLLIVIGTMWFSNYNQLKRLESLLDDAETELREQLAVQGTWMHEWVRTTHASTEEWIGWLNEFDEEKDVINKLERSLQLAELVRTYETAQDVHPELDWDAFAHAQARVRDAQQSYNASVGRYNRRVSAFPGSLVAKAHQFATYAPIQVKGDGPHE